MVDITFPIINIYLSIFILIRNPGAFTLEDELEKAIHLAGGITSDNVGDFKKVKSRYPAGLMKYDNHSYIFIKID